MNITTENVWNTEKGILQKTLLNSPGWNKKQTIGVVFDFAYVSQLPVDSWDKPLEMVITENLMTTTSLQ